MLFLESCKFGAGFEATVVRENLRPLGMSAGDFDLVVAPDGKAYYYFERVHSETICADLTDDYTNVTGYCSTHFPHRLKNTFLESFMRPIRYQISFIISVTSLV